MSVRLVMTSLPPTQNWNRFGSDPIGYSRFTKWIPVKLDKKKYIFILDLNLEFRFVQRRKFSVF